jgi:hypothetical protein
MQKEDKLLIDRYLENTLTGVELKNFIDRLESDTDFRKKVSFHNLLIEGIQEAENKRLRQNIIHELNYRKPLIPSALKLILAFFLIIVLGISFWNYISPDSNGKKHDYFSLNFLHKIKSDSSTLNTKSGMLIHNKKTELKPLIIQEDSLVGSNQSPLPDTIKRDVEEAADIVVKKDQLLISYTLKSRNLGDASRTSEETSLAKNAAEKLNPAGNLPETEKKSSENYFVEFWVSPVNYKGYKLVDDKLILFGIEEPDAVKLYTKNEKLWMKYGHDVFGLEPTEDFESLIRTNEIPPELR